MHFADSQSGITKHTEGKIPYLMSFSVCKFTNTALASKEPQPCPWTGCGLKYLETSNKISNSIQHYIAIQLSHASLHCQVRTSGYPSRYVLKVLEKTCMFRILFYANTNFSVHIYMYSRTSLSHTTMISPSTFTSTTSLPAITQCNPDHPC